MESAWPRTIAASRFVILRAGSGSRALPGDRPGRSAAIVTPSSGFFAIARRHDVTARLNGSVGASFDPVRNLEFDVVITTSPPSSPHRRPGEGRDPEPPAVIVVMCSGTITLSKIPGVWVPAFAGTTLEPATIRTAPRSPTTPPAPH